MGRTGSSSVVATFCRRILQIWGTLGERVIEGGRDSLGRGWVLIPKKSWTGNQEYPGYLLEPFSHSQTPSGPLHSKTGMEVVYGGARAP